MCYCNTGIDGNARKGNNHYTAQRQLGTYQEVSTKRAAQDKQETSQTLEANGSSDHMLHLDKFITEHKLIND